MFFKDFKTFETEVAGRKLVIETGKMAQLANGACIVRYGETEVLCTATMAPKPREGVDFFPLSVDFEEKLYAVGRIPGSFGRREGKASEKAVLTSRVIDRPIRPLFPKDGGLLSVLRIKCHSERSEESVHKKWTHTDSSLCSE